MQDFYVYMLKCSDHSFYVGHTDNLAKRITEHQAGVVPCYTKKRLPVTLVWSQACASREDALAAEIKIKRWTHRKKEALINGNWQEISKLAKKKF